MTSADTTMGHAYEPRVRQATSAAIARLRAPASFKAAALAATRMRKGAVDVMLPTGEAFRVGAPAETNPGVLIVKDYGFARRLFQAGDIGFAEGFMAGEWDSPNLARTLTVFADNMESLGKVFLGGFVSKWINALRHWRNRNTREGARRNILAHYDLGNAFYERWLDPSMTYSSALFAEPNQALEAAQRNKYRALAERIGLREGEHVLEIGCGWGGFAEFAAGELGAKVTGLTISDAQFAYAQERMQRKGLSDRVTLKLQDYRDEQGRYDKIASIEMFEAVGEEYWPAFFGKVHDCLKPGGQAGLQIITIADQYFSAYRRRPDFIQRHIFPGGMLPSPSRLREEFASAGLTHQETASFGKDYARTLAIWGERFVAAWDGIRAETAGFDESFKRLWRFYLAYCEAGFTTGRTDVVQVALSRD